MNARTSNHKRNVIIWITTIVAMTSWILFVWWVDTKEFTTIDNWSDWMEDIHFFAKLGVMVVIFSIITVVLHWYWKLIDWIVTKFVNKFY
jgi:hypothetical protein